jgi:hypothetical protein
MFASTLRTVGALNAELTTVLPCSSEKNTFLPFYIECCKRIVRQKDGVISPVDVGPFFLTNLYKMMPFPLVTTVGLFTPPILVLCPFNC